MLRATQFEAIDDREVEEQAMTPLWFVLSMLAAAVVIGGIVLSLRAEARRDRATTVRARPPVTLTPADSR